MKRMPLEAMRKKSGTNLTMRIYSSKISCLSPAELVSQLTPRCRRYHLLRPAPDSLRIMKVALKTLELHPLSRAPLQPLLCLPAQLRRLAILFQIERLPSLRPQVEAI